MKDYAVNQSLQLKVQKSFQESYENQSADLRKETESKQILTNNFNKQTQELDSVRMELEQLKKAMEDIKSENEVLQE